MQRRENYLYIGMDLHKESHTAVSVGELLERKDRWKRCLILIKCTAPYFRA